MKMLKVLITLNLITFILIAADYKYTHLETKFTADNNYLKGVYYRVDASTANIHYLHNGSKKYIVVQIDKEDGGHLLFRWNFTQQI